LKATASGLGNIAKNIGNDAKHLGDAPSAAASVAG
jgi:hypothetical protein